ncbi:hypothetical protein [Rhizohabitans arisaemae]|uniref:hypothetical protein n=1 Tax=Rhizohabitans arisaemae TaxID=2720610 RepID=UPI0024B1AD98|nr:hypothetical protein [Rhizohabitans arisaemae]
MDTLGELTATITTSAGSVIAIPGLTAEQAEGLSTREIGDGGYRLTTPRGSVVVRSGFSAARAKPGQGS